MLTLALFGAPPKVPGGRAGIPYAFPCSRLIVLPAYIIGTVNLILLGPSAYDQTPPNLFPNKAIGQLSSSQITPSL